MAIKEKKAHNSPKRQRREDNMKDMIEGITSLTIALSYNELTDETYIQTLIQDHYEKYRQFYYAVCDIASELEEYVSSTQCHIHPTKLSFDLYLDSDEHAQEYLDSVEGCRSLGGNYLEKHFTFSISRNDSVVNITVENKGFLREDELYNGNKFD